MIDHLINKQDTFQLVRDRIALILANESASQMALAEAAELEPAPWQFDVYVERSEPWACFRRDGDAAVPVVNVWFKSDTFEENASNIGERQKATGIVCIDCYVAAESREEEDGHSSGDELAALEAQRVVSLVRNIVMSAEYTYLGMRETVWKRWVRERQTFVPPAKDASATNYCAARLTFAVEYNEFSPQITPETLETLACEVARDPDGRVLVNASYTYT